MPGLESIQPQVPPQAAGAYPASTPEVTPQVPQGQMPAGLEQMQQLPPEALQMGRKLVESPHIQPALQALQQAAQAFPEKGPEAFRDPAVTQALGMAFAPLIEQSVGQPLGNGMVVGQVQLADTELTPANTLKLKLMVQPVNEQTGEPGQPYEAWLTENRIPEAHGGKAMELTAEEVQQTIQGLGEIAKLQQQAPEQIQQMRAKPLYDLMF